MVILADVMEKARELANRLNVLRCYCEGCVNPIAQALLAERIQGLRMAAEIIRDKGPFTAIALVHQKADELEGKR